MKVFAFLDGIRELYGIASTNHQYYEMVDAIEELGLEWDIEL